MRDLIKIIKHLFHPQRSNNHRPKVLHPEAFVAFIFLSLGFWIVLHPGKNLIQDAGSVLGYASNISASQVISKTNQERANQGLPALSNSAQLNQAALAKAQYMMSHQFWAHFAPDGTSPWKFFQDAHYRYSVAGENLARDFSNTDDMMRAWMASPTHRANIVNGRYKEIGVAVVDGKLLGSETTLVVQLFGTPLGGAPQINAPKKQALNLAPRQAVLSATDETPVPQPAKKQPQEETLIDNKPTLAQLPNQPNAQVLASTVLPVTSLSTSSAILSPLQLSKAFFLAMIFVIVMTLIYDSVIMNNRNTVRLVGKNFAHILLFTVVGFLLLLFKGGVIG